MIASGSNEGPAPIGHSWLRREFDLAIPPSPVESFVVQGARRTEIRDKKVLQFYPRQHAVGNSVVANLKFALRNEPSDIGCLIGTLRAMKRPDLEDWIRSEPTGAFSR